MFPLRDDVPARRSPIVLYALVVVNVLVFLYELSLPAPALRQFVANLGVVPADFAGPGGRIEPEPSALATLFTSMFIHAGWLHILVNMWYLWIFGNNIEDRMGHLRFLVFYLLGGVAAGLAHLALNWGSPVPSIGASGAVAAVLGAYLLLYPRARILTIVPFFFLWVVRLPALLVLGAWFALQLLSGIASVGPGAAQAGVAYWAHIGGFLFGLLAVRLFARKPRRVEYGPRPQESWWPT